MTIRSRVSHSVLLSLSILLLRAGSAGALDIYLIRHAETMGNVTGDYSEENQCSFSPLGWEQVAGIPEKLKDYRFDTILVSPTWRTQQTILPYLKATGRQAEFLPEIEEGDCGIRGNEPLTADIPLGEVVQIVEGAEDCFVWDADRPYRRYAPQNTSEGLSVLKRGVDRILSRFGGTEKSILLVTHSCTGGRILELLLGLEARGMLFPNNAALSHIAFDRDGKADLIRYNDRPFGPLERMLLFGLDRESAPDSLDLAGTWSVAPGDDAAWSEPDADEEGFLETQVPGNWEQDALPDYDGVGWYRLRFSVSPEQREAWAENPLTLILGAVDDADETYLNGRRIGAGGRFSPERISAWNEARLYRVEPGWILGENVLSVRVEDWGGGGGIWRGPVGLVPDRALSVTVGGPGEKITR